MEPPVRASGCAAMTLDDEIEAINYAIAHLKFEMKGRALSEERRKAMHEVIQTLRAMRANLKERRQHAATSRRSSMPQDQIFGSSSIRLHNTKFDTERSPGATTAPLRSLRRDACAGLELREVSDLERTQIGGSLHAAVTPVL
jgi:hypothetical protein